MAELKTLFHFSFAVNDLDRARRFYGAILGCPEGRKLPGRADFNFFGHHLVAHLAPDEVVGSDGRKVGESKKTPLRHFGVVMTLEDFRKTAERLVVELKDKMPARNAARGQAEAEGLGPKEDLLSALANLGYSRGEAERGVERALRDDGTGRFEDLLRRALQAVSGR